MQMFGDILKAHILRFVEFDEADLNKLPDFFQVIEVGKKKNLLTEGKICKSNFFVATGCLRMFFVNEKGIEQTIQFALESWWISDYTSFSSQKPTDYFIQAVELSVVLALDFSAQEQMLNQFPQMERYFRLMHQRAHAATQFRIRNLYELSSEERYHRFVSRYPDFVQRIPQYLLASYLGLTPEYLSEIKAKKFS